MEGQEHETKVEVGRFTFDTATQVLTGPADYFADRGGVDKAVENALASTVYNYGVTSGESPSPIVAMLVAMQTDYAGFKGSRDYFGR